MDRSTALQLAADEMEERELRYSRIEILEYVPSDPSRGVLAPPGSVTVFVSYEGSPILERVRAAVADSSSSGLDLELSLEIRKMFRGRERMTYYQAYQLLRASSSFATVRYGSRTLATNIFPPGGPGRIRHREPDLVVLENPYNGGRLEPDELTLVEHRIPETEFGLAAVALRHAPPLTEIERAALEQVPENQLEMNLSMRADCCDNWTDFAQVVVAVTFAMLCMDSPIYEQVSLPEERVKRLGPAASARELLKIRRELLGHSHG